LDSRGLRSYLRDPFLKGLYDDIRAAGRLRSVSLDLTNICNLRCTGCYYFSEGMDALESPSSEEAFDDWIRAELDRDTNFVTIVGGEPGLYLDRVKKIYDNFRMNIATNGLRRIPYEGFEEMPIGVAVWGDHDSDRELRGGGKRDIFSTALKNYRDDPRAFFYYTVTPGRAHEIESVVGQCVENGNRVLYNFYSDLDDVGGDLDYRSGFDAVCEAIDRTIEKYPDQILLTSHFANIISSGELLGERWGYDVCTNVSFDNPVNAVRTGNGNPYNRHFRAYNADFRTTRRCCTGIDRSCDSCFDVWERFSWVMINMRKHLGTVEDFTDWLTTTYLFYVINRLVDYETGISRLPEIHERTRPLLAVSRSRTCRIVPARPSASGVSTLM
jgi:hypothetical protein